MRTRPVLLTAAAAATALVLAACGGEEPEDDTGDGQEPAPAGDELPAVEGGFGEDPEITWPGTGAPDELMVEVLDEGEGEEVGPDHFVIADYRGQVWDVDDAFDSSFEREAPTGFNLNFVIDGWQEGLSGAQVGDRVVLSAPPEMAYGDSADNPDIPPNSTLVFVVDIVEAYGPDSAGEADAQEVGSAEELSLEIDGELGAPVSVSVPQDAQAPDEVETLLLAEGSGEPVPEGQDAVIQYAWTTWDNNTGGSSWEETGAVNALSPYGIGQIWSELADLPVGSRAAVVIPPAEDDSQPATALVVDIIAPVPASR